MSKYIFTFLVSMLSTAAFADAGLDGAITTAKNSVDIQQIAQAVLCGETLNDRDCSFMYFGVPAPNGGPYGNIISILNQAKLTTTVFSEAEMSRIQNAIDNLEKHN